MATGGMQFKGGNYQMNVTLDASKALDVAKELDAVLEKVGTTLRNISRGRDVSALWNQQAASIENVADALERYSRNVNSVGNAEELIKSLNAFKAWNPELKDIDIFSRLKEGAEDLIATAGKLATNLDSAFDVPSLRDAFDALEALKSAGVDVDEIVTKLGQGDVSQLTEQIRNLQRQLVMAQGEARALQEQVSQYESGEAFEEMREKLSALEEATSRAQKEFASFLSSVGFAGEDIDPNDKWGRFSEYFEQIADGSMTAKEAIADFKRTHAGMFDSVSQSDLAMIVERLEQLASTIEEVRRSVTDMGGSGSVSDMRRTFEEGAEAARTQNAEMQQMGTNTAVLETLIQELTRLAEASAQSGEAAQAANGQLVQLLSSLNGLSQADPTALEHIADALMSMSRMDGLSVGKASMQNLVSAMEALSRLPNTSVLQGLSTVDLRNFNDLHISKASLSNMAEFLPTISSVNVGTLQQLAGINWDNLNNLSVSKAALSNLSQFANSLTINGGTVGLNETGLSTLSRSIEDAIQRASKNIKLTIDNVELSAAAQKKLADNAQQAASGGTKRAASGSAKPAVEEETAAIEKNIDAWYRDQEAWREAQDEKARAAGWAAAEALEKEEAALEREREAAIKAADEFEAAEAKKASAAAATAQKVEEAAARASNATTEKLASQLARLDIGSSGIKFTEDESAMNRYRAALESAKAALDNLRTASAADKAQAVADTEAKIAAVRTLRDELNQAAKAESLAGKIDVFLSKNGKLSADTKTQLHGWATELRDGTALAEGRIDGIANEFGNLQSAIRVAQSGGKSFFQTLREGWSKFGGWSLVTRSFTKAISTFKQMVTAVKEVDSAMTELRKVTDLTSAGYEQFYNNATKMASRVGSSLSDTINAVADFSRLGYDIDMAQELAEASLLYQNVADGLENVSEATNSLISTIKAFGDETYSATQIVDMFNEVGNNFAISSAGIGEALQRSAAALATAGNSLEQSIGLIVAANDVVQNPEVVGTAMKTLSMYYRSAKTEAEEAGIATDGMAESTAKLREELLALTGQKVDIQLNEHEFKSTYQVLQELSKVWDDIGKTSEINQARILEMLGGKRNANVLASIIKNFKDAEDAAATAANSTGSAWAENEKYLQSIEGKTKQLKASFETMANAVVNSDLVKTFVDAGRAVADIVTWLQKMGLLLPTIIGLVTTIKTLSAVTTATNTANTIFDILKGAGDTDSKITKITASISQLGTIAKHLAGTKVLSGLGDLSLDKDLASKVTDVAKAMQNASLKTLTFDGAITALKTKLTGLGQGLNTVIHSSIGKWTIGITAVIAAFTAANAMIQNAIQDSIERGNEAYQSTQNTINNAEKGTKELSKLSEEFAELSKGVDKHGNNVSLTDDQYDRYLELVQEIIKIAPALEDAYNKKGASLQTGYVDILKAANEEQGKLIRNAKEAVKTSWETTLGGSRNEINASYGTGPFGIVTGKEVYQPLVDIYERSITAGVTKGSESAEEILKKTIGEDLYKQLRDTYVDDAGYVYLNAKAVYELYNSYEELERALKAAGAKTDWLSGAFGKLEPYVKTYKSELGQVADTMMILAEVSDETGKSFEKISQAGQTDTFYSGLLDILDPGAAPRDNYNALIAYVEAFSDAMDQLEQARQRMANGETWAMVYDDWNTQFGGFPAIMRMFEDAFTSATQSEEESAAAASNLTKTYGELVEALSDVSKATSLLEKARNGDTSTIEMLKQAEELAALLRNKGYDVELDNMFEIGEDGKINWHISSLERYVEDLIRAAFAGTELAESHPEVVDAIVAEALAFNDATQSATSFAEALGAVTEASDLKEAVKNFDGTDEAMLSILNKVQDVVDAWNKIRGDNEQIDASYFIGFKDGKIDFSKLTSGLNEYKSAMFENSEAAQALEAKFPGIIDYLKKMDPAAAQAAESTLTLSDALDQLGDAADALQNGIGGNNLAEQLANADKLAEQYNTVLKKLGEMGLTDQAADFGWREFLTFDENGIKENVNTIRAYYDALIEYIVASRPELNNAEQKQFRAYLRSWVDDMIDADEVKRKTQEIKDAFSSIKDIADYQKALADYRKFDGSVSYFDMLEKMYSLAEQYDDIDLKDLWDFDASTFKDLGDIQLDKMLDKLAKDLKINAEEVEDWKNHVKKSFEEAKQLANEYETASKSINIAGSMKGFLESAQSGDKDPLDMLSSAVSLAEDLGLKLGDVVKIGSDGKLTYNTEALLTAFDKYIDDLVTAGNLNAVLAAQIKSAARAEAELADNAKIFADSMDNTLARMQGLYGFAEAGKNGETDILAALRSAKSEWDSYREALEEGFKGEPLSLMDFLTVDESGIKENVNTAKKLYKEYANQLIDDWIAQAKEANKGKEGLITGVTGWENGLTQEEAKFFHTIKEQIVGHLEDIDKEIEPTIGDIISNLQTLTDFRAKSGEVVDFSSVWDDLEKLKTILGDDKLTLNDIIDWDTMKYRTDLVTGKIEDLANTIATQLVDAEIEGGAAIEDRTAAIEDRAKRIQAALTGVADTWSQLTTVVGNVKSIQSVREDYNSYLAGDMSLLDMLTSATSLAETLGISLDDAFTIGSDGEMVLNIEAMENGLIGVIDNLEKSGVCSANLAAQLREAARAEAQVETNAEKIKKAYSSFNDANAFGSGLTRGQQLTYDDYQSMIERDARYAESVEYVNGVMSVNRDKYNEITAAIAGETAELALLEAAQRKLKIDEYQKELDTNTKLTNKERSAMEKQIEKLKLEAKGYTVLANEIANATNQFERFRNASGNADADTYMDAQSALKMLEDVLYNTESELYGQLGNDKFQEAVRLLIDPEFDFKEEDVKAAYQELREKLNRYFGEGTEDNPQTSRTNMFSFWQDLQEKGFVGIDEKGYGYLDSSKANIEDIAKAFGLTKDAARAALQELEQWSQTDFDWEHIDPEYYNEVLKKAEDLAKTAEEAKATAEDLTKKAEDARKTADEAAAKLEEAKKSGDQSQIDAAEAVANEAEQSAQAAEKARDEANAAAEQAAQAAADAKKTDNEKLAENLQEIIDQVEQIKNTPVEIDATQAIESTTSVVEQLQSMVDLLAEMQRINAELLEIGSTTDEAQGKVDTLGKSEVNVDTTPAIKSVSELMDYIVAAENDVANLSSMDIFLDSNPAIQSIQSVLDALAVLSRAIDEVNSKTIKTPPSGSGSGGDGGGDGGGSGARGIVSSPGGRTLVGELGREIVVDVNSGRWYTVGDNGPELVNLPKNAIVYNARKTEEILGKRMLDLSGFSMASGTSGSKARNSSGTNNNSSVGGGMINIDALATPLEETSKKTGQISEQVEDAVDILEQIAEAYKLANDTLEHLIEHEEFSYYKAERAANFDGMNTYLANEIELYKAIMKNSQEGIEELKRNGADDGNEYLQELEEAYWDAYKSMYEALDNIRSLYTDALSDEIDNIQAAYKNIVSAASEYNDRGQISLDTFQAILDNGIEYLGILQDENGELGANQNAARDLLKVRRDQLAIETAISYVNRLNEALTNGEVQKVAELVDAKGQIGRSSWDIVYANLAALKAQGLSNEQYEKALENIRKLQELANVAMDEFDSEDKIAEAKSKFEDLNKELEHYIEHQKFAFDVGDRDMNFTAMNQALEREVGYYKRIMDEAQKTIAEMTALGADDTNESLQSIEESYWSAYRSMYNVLDQMRQLRVDALSNRLNGLTKSFSNLKKAADEYNKAEGISLDTFQSLLDDGFQYMSLLEEQNGQYVIAKDRVNQLIDARKNQLAVESALSYISQVREALETGATERLQNLLDATDAVTNSTWGYVYAQAALLKASMSDAQYKAFIANIDKMKALADSVIYDYASSEGDATAEYEKQADALDDILKYTEELIRAETKDRIDAINDEIDAYKEIIKLKKESLDTTKEENEYQEGVAEKVKEIAELQAKADLLALDTSRSATAERQKLLQEIADKQKDLAKYQTDYAIDAQKDALDKEAEDYEEARKIEIEELEKTISSEEKVYQLAIARIRDQWDTLYADLIAWNTEQGSVINQEITDAWEAATRAVEKYGSAVEAIKQTKQTGENLVVADIPKYHSGGEVGNEGSINKDEVLAVLKKGELVATNPMKKVIYSAVDFVKTLSEKIGVKAEAIRSFAVDNVASKIAPAFALPNAEPCAVGNTNVAFSASFNVSVNGADLGDNDPKTFGRAIASAAADDLFEAFNRRGINSIRTLRQ